jgi:hypothetical protein
LTKFVYEFCGLDPLGTLALVDIATSVASTTIFYESSLKPLAFLTENIHCENTSLIFTKIL